MNGDSAGVGVFVVDDHDVVRDGLRGLIDATDDLTVVGEARGCSEARHLIPVAAPDVAVIDLRLPDGSGIDVCRHIAHTSPQTRSVILTSFDEDDAFLAAVDAGAAAFVIKQARAREVLETIREVARGRRLIDLRRIRAREQRAARADPVAPDRMATLTQRQRSVLDLVAAGLTNCQIAAELGLSEKTVKNTVSSILTTLNVARRVEAAVIATQLAPEPSS